MIISCHPEDELGMKGLKKDEQFNRESVGIICTNYLDNGNFHLKIHMLRAINVPRWHIFYVIRSAMDLLAIEYLMKRIRKFTK
ncbi:MAG: hypothetical protein C5B59_02545 [Bacteroidetes bacterium]|nr:MAG: hypothetical protein C5B59_02545 [Bacteroidota bacterium]